MGQRLLGLWLFFENRFKVFKLTSFVKLILLPVARFFPLLLIINATKCIHEGVACKLFSHLTSLAVKDIVFICLDRLNEGFSRQHAMLVAKIVSVDLPHLQLHLRVVRYEMHPNIFLIRLVTAPNRTDTVTQQLVLVVFMLGLKVIKQILVSVLDMSKPLGNRLVAHLTVH